MILFALISSRVPFSGADKKQTGHNIVNQPLSFDRPVWNSVSIDCKELLLGMLEKDQNRRMSINEVLAHPWMN